jgi:hypothetical protein
MLGATTGPDGFTAERVMDPALRALRKNVTVMTDPAAEHGSAPTRVRVVMGSGTMLEACVPVFDEIHEEGLRAERSRVEEKFIDSAVPLLGRSRAERVIERVADIIEVRSVRRITGLLSVG